MSTKRRRVWVEFEEFDTGDEAVVHFGRFPRAVPFIERLPGDVVLSREEVAARKHAAERLESWLKDMKMENFDECDHIRRSCGDAVCTRPVTEAIALLRGRR